MPWKKYSLTASFYLARPLWRVPFLVDEITCVYGTCTLAVAGYGMLSGERSIHSYMLVILDSTTGAPLRAYTLSSRAKKLRDLRDGRHIVAIRDDGALQCWDVLTLREVTKERLITHWRPLIDIAFQEGGQPVACLIGAHSGSSKKIVIRDRVAYKHADAEFLSLSPDGRFVAVYAKPNRFLIFDVDNPKAHRWVGAPRGGMAKCCWIPGTHRFVVFSTEGECLRDLRKIFHEAIMWAKSNNWKIVPSQAAPTVEQSCDAHCGEWLRCYQVEVSNSVMNVNCVWERSLTNLDYYTTSEVVCHGGEILMISDYLIRAGLDGSIKERQPLYQYFSSVSNCDEGGRIWAGTADGNILTVAEALKPSSFCHEQWAAYQLTWGPSILWASNAEYREYSYALAAYDLVTRKKILQWKLPRQEEHVVPICLQGGPDGRCAYIVPKGGVNCTAITVYRACIAEEQLVPVAHLSCADKGHNEVKSMRPVALLSAPGFVELLAVEKLSEAGSLYDESTARLVWLQSDKQQQLQQIASFGPLIGRNKLSRIRAVCSIAGQQKILVLLELQQVPYGPGDLCALAVLESNGMINVVCQTNTEKWEYCLALAAVGGAYAVLGMGDNRILCVDLTTRRYRWKVGVNAGVCSLSASCNQDLIAIGLENGELELRDMDNGNLVGSRQLHLGPVNTVAWGPGGQLATGGADGKIIIWRVESLS